MIYQRIRIEKEKTTSVRASVVGCVPNACVTYFFGIRIQRFVVAPIIPIKLKLTIYLNIYLAIDEIIFSHNIWHSPIYEYCRWKAVDENVMFNHISDILYRNSISDV